MSVGSLCSSSSPFPFGLTPRCVPQSGQALYSSLSATDSAFWGGSSSGQRQVIAKGASQLHMRHIFYFPATKSSLRVLIVLRPVLCVRVICLRTGLVILTHVPLISRYSRGRFLVLGPVSIPGHTPERPPTGVPAVLHCCHAVLQSRLAQGGAIPRCVSVLFIFAF